MPAEATLWYSVALGNPCQSGTAYGAWRALALLMRDLVGISSSSPHSVLLAAAPALEGMLPRALELSDGMLDRHARR